MQSSAASGASGGCRSQLPKTRLQLPGDTDTNGELQTGLERDCSYDQACLAECAMLRNELRSCWNGRSFRLYWSTERPFSNRSNPWRQDTVLPWAVR